MALEKFIPQSPDRFIRNSKDFEVARFGHLNEMIDYINNYVLPDGLQLVGSGPMTTTLRAITDNLGNASRLSLSTDTTAISADLKFTGATSGFVAIQAPNTVTSYTLTLPTATGTPGQVLITDGSGNLSFGTISLNTGVLEIQGGVPLDGTLRSVTDQASTVSPLSISTTAVQVNSTLKITTDGEPYLDVEDTLTNNRFTIGKAPASQKVYLDFASNPTGSTTIVGAIRTYKDGISLSDTMVFREDGHIGIGETTSPSGLLHVDGGAAIPRMILDADTNVARIFSFRTNDLPRWAFRIDDNETGTNAGSNFAIRRYNDAGTFVAAPISINRATGLTTISESLNLGGSELQNFSANLETLAANTTFDSSNTATYNGSVTKVSGARTFTFDNTLPLGFTMTVIQTDINQTTFAGAGAAVIRNRQSHTKNNGQYSVVSIVKIDNNSFVLGGDTAA